MKRHQVELAGVLGFVRKVDGGNVKSPAFSEDHIAVPPGVALSQTWYCMPVGVLSNLIIGSCVEAVSGISSLRVFGLPAE